MKNEFENKDTEGKEDITSSTSSKEVVDNEKDSQLILTEDELRHYQKHECNKGYLETTHPNLSREFLERMIKVMGDNDSLETPVINKDVKVIHNISIVIKDGKATIQDLPVNKD